jgi:hypothetical protein
VLSGWACTPRTRPRIWGATVYTSSTLRIAGWAGAAAILSAFLAVSMGWLKTGRAFQTANLLGAIAFIINGAFHEAWPSVVTNVGWFLISAIALFRIDSASQPPGPAIVDAQQIQFPGVTETTGPVEVVDAPCGLCRGAGGEGSSPT